MNSLRTHHSLLTGVRVQCKWTLSNRGRIAPVAQPENEMLATSIIALISTAGIALYARFLVALHKGRKSPRRTFRYSVRLDCDEAKAIDLASKSIPTHILGIVGTTRN